MLSKKIFAPLYIVLAIVLLLNSCKKSKPKPEEKAPEPEIVALPSSAYVNQEITIKGKYSYPLEGKVFINDEEVPIISSSANEIVVQIPIIPYPTRKAKITVVDKETTWSKDLLLADVWLAVSSQSVFNHYLTIGTFTISNTSYMMARTDDEQGVGLFQFNNQNYTWKRLELPLPKFAYAVLTQTATKAYLYIWGAESNFWEYNPATNAWKALANHPVRERSGGAMFAIGDKVYLGMGSSSDLGSQAEDNSFYRYNITDNDWERALDFPAPLNSTSRLSMASFVINNIAYVGCGATNSGQNDFHSYNQSTGQWQRVADLPDARMATCSFMVKGYGYVATGFSFDGGGERDCYRYNPATNKWTLLKDHIGVELLGGDGIRNSFSFVNEGKVYIGEGFGGGPTNYLLQADQKDL